MPLASAHAVGINMVCTAATATMRSGCGVQSHPASAAAYLSQGLEQLPLLHAVHVPGQEQQSIIVNAS
jgi:hypothetical protein